MAKKFRIFADVSAGSIFFDGGRIPPAPLGGKVLASDNGSGRVRVVRTDLFAKDGVTPRRIFKGLKVGRIKNQANQILSTDLGFNLTQIIDYINDQANKKVNEIDFQKNGALVGGGTTINFTGQVGSISVSNDVVTVGIATTVSGSGIIGNINSAQLTPHITGLGGVNFTLGTADNTPAFDLTDAHSYPFGISTSGGMVGSGITLFDFRGSGVSTVTPVTSGITTVFFEGGSGSAGNPVTSGILTSSNSTLRLTLQDATTVDVDVSALNNVSPVSLAASTSYFYLNSGVQLANNQHDKNNGVVFYGTPVRRGEEIVFALPSGSVHVGIWNGGNGITGITNVSDRANWSTKFRYSSDDTRWQNANTTQGKVGIDQSTDIETSGGTFAVRFDHQTEKLQLWNIDTAYDWHVATANVAVGATQTYIYFSSGDNTQTTPPQSLPGISTLRSQDFTLKSYTDSDRPGASYYNGTKVNDVWKSNKSLRPGMKVKFTVPTTAGNQYWATNFEGTEDLGSGENNAYQAGEMTWRLTNQEKFTAHEDATMNTNYTAMDTSSTTLALPGRNMSWRYNADNTWDIFDEDTDEVVLTGDDTLDGGDMYPYLLAVNNSDDVLSDYAQFEWEWSNANWFTEYRDYVSGASGTKFISKTPNGKPLKTYSQAIPTQSGGFYYLGNANYRVTWGEKMRPGQEFSWTQLSDNSNGATKNNMVIGVLNSDSDAFTAGIHFKQTGQPKNQSDQTSGFTISAGIDDTTACSGKSMRLQYEYGTNKLVCYSLNAGVRTKLAESTSALDGNPIFITLGGESTRIPTTQGVSVYGWEITHRPPNYYNPWNNWRIGSFPENQTGVGVGTHVSGNSLAWEADQAWRHKDGIPQGYKMHWLLPTSHPNAQIGQWNTGNASSGLSNIENNDTYWDWSFQSNTSEEIDALKGFTFNTSNSNYSATKWTDPNPGSTKFSIRYHGNNTVDLFDESNQAIIATKDVNADGNPIYISWAGGGATTTQSAMQDDFFGGGDVGIALTTATV